MSESDSLAGIGVAMGLALGSGLGTTAAALSGVSIGSLLGFGTGGGLIVGAATAQLVRVNADQPRLRVRAVGGGAFFGVLVGAPIGMVSAWVADGSLLVGVGVGLLAGLAHGALVGALLYTQARRTGLATPEDPSGDA